MKAFFKSLGVAAASGAVTAATHSYMTGNVDPKVTGSVALAGAIAGVLSYLLKSPLGQKAVAPSVPVEQ